MKILKIILPILAAGLVAGSVILIVNLNSNSSNDEMVELNTGLEAEDEDISNNDSQTPTKEDDSSVNPQPSKGTENSQDSSAKAETGSKTKSKTGSGKNSKSKNNSNSSKTEDGTNATDPTTDPVTDPTTDEDTRVLATSVSESFSRQKSSSLLKAGLLRASAGVTLTSNDTDGTVKAQLSSTNARIYIDKDFNFDTYATNRFSFGAGVNAESQVTLSFYLDDATAPFLTRSVKPMRDMDAAIAEANKNRPVYSDPIKVSLSPCLDTSIDITELNLKGTHRLSIGVQSTTSDASFAIDYVEFVCSSVPTIYFNIDETKGTIAAMNADEEHEARCYGDMSLQVPNKFVSEYTGEEAVGGQYKLSYLRGRGSSTWHYVKKPYKIKLDKSTDLLGMGKSKEWALIANYCDNSLLRNKISYWLGEQTGMEFTPKSEPVDVVMNGEYIGSYMLSQTVEVTKSRVNIGDGYLLSLFFRPSDYEGQPIVTSGAQKFFLEYPEYDGEPNQTELTYITNYMETLATAIEDGDEKTAAQMLDFRSTAIFFMLQSLSNNSDAFVTDSTYLYKKEDGKLYFGPLWDFDYTTWGETKYGNWETQGYTESFGPSVGGPDGTFWVYELLKFDSFVEEYKKAWTDMREALITLTKEDGQISWYRDRLATTAYYNFEALGPSQIMYIDPNGRFYGPVTLTWEQEIARLTEWVSKTIAPADEYFPSIIPEYIDLSFISSIDGSEIASQREMLYGQLSGFPEAPKKTGYRFLGWKVCSGGESNYAGQNVQVYEDMYILAQYIAEADYIPITSMSFKFSSYNESAYASDSDMCIVVSPSNATLFTEGLINYSSDNEDVVYYAGDGVFYCGSDGDATISATADGITATASVHVMPYGS